MSHSSNTANITDLDAIALGDAGREEGAEGAVGVPNHRYPQEEQVIEAGRLKASIRRLRISGAEQRSPFNIWET